MAALSSNTILSSSASTILDFTRIICERNSKRFEKDGINISTSIVQNKSKQDACGYVKGKEFDIVWCSDSHGGRVDGKSKTIRDFLNSISDERWIEYLSQDNFYKGGIDESTNAYTSHLFEDIAKQGPYSDTGATLSIVKITPTTIECYRVGDSPIYVFRDGENILYSNHEEEYSSDILKLKERNYFKYIHGKCVTDNGVTEETDIRALSETDMEIFKSNYIYWHTGFATNMTRSIGHNYPRAQKRCEENFKFFKKSPDDVFEVSLPDWTMTKTVIERIPETKEKIIVATDGFSCVSGTFDYERMYSAETATDIMVFTYKRWIQEWTAMAEGIAAFKQRLPDWNRDDIAIVMWNN